MGLLTLFRRTAESPLQSPAQKLIDEAMPLVGKKAERLSSGIWTMPVPHWTGHAMQLDVGVNGELATAVVTGGLVFYRELILRRLMLVALELNDHCTYGSFRLIPIDGRRALVLGHSFDSRVVDAGHVAAACGVMVQQMDAALQQFVRMELIAPG